MAIFQNKVVILIIGSLIAASAAWYIFLRDTTTPTTLLTSDDLTTATGADKDVVETLLALRAITLSGTIFTDPAFVALKDNGIQIVPEPVGRPNPFLPLPGTTQSSTSTAGTSAASPAASSSPRR